MLVSFTIEDTACPAPNPVLNQDYPAYKDRQAEPTTGSNKDSTVMLEPTPLRATKDHIASEPEQQAPDQVFKPGMSSIADGVLVEFEGLEVSPVPPPTLESWMSCWMMHC